MKEMNNLRIKTAINKQNTTTDAFKYYSKHKNGKYWFAKQITENKYVLIEFTKFADDITVSAIKTASKDKASIWIGDLFLNDLKIKNE
jgi:hypothetical protein